MSRCPSRRRRQASKLVAAINWSRARCTSPGELPVLWSKRLPYPCAYEHACTCPRTAGSTGCGSGWLRFGPPWATTQHRYGIQLCPACACSHFAYLCWALPENKATLASTGNPIRCGRVRRAAYWYCPRSRGQGPRVKGRHWALHTPAAHSCRALLQVGGRRWTPLALCGWCKLCRFVASSQIW